MPPEPDLNGGQLVDVRLVGIDFAVKPDFDFDFDGLTFGVDRDVDAALGEETSSVILSVTITWDAEEGRIPPFDLRVRVEGTFEWVVDERESPEREIGWLKFNGPYLMWPYARSHVASITAACGLPPLTLPTLVVPSLAWIEEDRPVEELESAEGG